MGECLIASLAAVSNITETIIAENATSPENNTITEDASTSTSNAENTIDIRIRLFLVGLLVALVLSIFFMSGWIIGFKCGMWRGGHNLIASVNMALNRHGAGLKVVAGRPVIQALQPGQAQVAKPVKVKSKKKFKPPVWSPPSRTPCIPKS